MTRTLKYAILGLLYSHDQTGYDLMKQFELTLNDFWAAKHSQIYPELHKLKEEGCVDFQIEIAGTSLEKKLYSITEKGREEFRLWLSEETIIPKTPKDVSRLKVFFSGFLTEAQRNELLRSLLTQHQARLKYLSEAQAKFPVLPEKSTQEFGDCLLLLGAVMREEMLCQWLEKCLELSEGENQDSPLDSPEEIRCLSSGEGSILRSLIRQHT